MNKLIKKHEEIIRYLIVGILTTLVSLISYYSLTFKLLDPLNALELQLANILSWIIAVIFAYISNRIIVFKSKNKKIKELISFIVARILTLLLDMGLMYLLVTVINFSDKIVKLIVQIIVILLNYLFSKKFVFKK